MKCINCTEGEPFGLDQVLASRLRAECARLQTHLRPNFPILSEANGYLRINGIIGTLDVGANTLFEIAPKTEPTDDWIHAVLDLLVGSDRVDIAGERRAGLSENRRNLLEAIASIYAARLERAVRRDGPILLMRRRQSRGPMFKGKLNVTKWVSRAIWEPHLFPVTFNALSVDHEFSRALSKVALLLASLSRSSITQGRLRSVARALRPGCADFSGEINPISLGPLPPQWGVYQPAWSIAVAVLSHRSMLRSRGAQQGVSVVIEAWPLLERLLERSLKVATQIGKKRGKAYEAPQKRLFEILVPSTDRAAGVKQVEPDGILKEHGKTIATFEAKYKRRSDASWPHREDVYQALVTAAACASPTAILVYPEYFPPTRWRVVGMNNQPVDLVAIGLGLFSYRHGAGDVDRAQRLLDLLEKRDLLETTSSDLLSSAG